MVRQGFDPVRDEFGRACLPLAFGSIWKPLMEVTGYREMKGEDIKQDLNYGIDVELLRKNRSPIMMAARFRNPEEIDRRDITIRERSLISAKMLEVRKSVARYMTYGWANTFYEELPKRAPTMLLDAVVVRLPELLDLYWDGSLNKVERKRNKDGSSTFLCFSLVELWSQGLVAYALERIIKQDGSDVRQLHKCCGCGWDWYSLNPYPVRCPVCKTRDWNKRKGN